MTFTLIPFVEYDIWFTVALGRECRRCYWDGAKDKYGRLSLIVSDRHTTRLVYPSDIINLVAVDPSHALRMSIAGLRADPQFCAFTWETKN